MTVNTLDQRVPGGEVFTAPNTKKRDSLWVALTRPSEKVQKIEERRRARLLAALLAVLTPLGLLSSIATLPINNPANNTFFILATLGTVLLLGGYLLSRTVHYRFGTVLLLTTISATSVLAVLLSGPAFVGVLFYLNLT